MVGGDSAGVPSWHLAHRLLLSWAAPQAGTQVKPPLPQHLSPWIKSPKGHERARALGLSTCLLRHFLQHLHVSVSTGPVAGYGRSAPVASPAAPCVGPSAWEPCMWPRSTEHPAGSLAFPFRCPRSCLVLPAGD